MNCKVHFHRSIFPLCLTLFPEVAMFCMFTNYKHASITNVFYLVVTSPPSQITCDHLMLVRCQAHIVLPCFLQREAASCITLFWVLAAALVLTANEKKSYRCFKWHNNSPPDPSYAASYYAIGHLGTSATLPISTSCLCGSANKQLWWNKTWGVRFHVRGSWSRRENDFSQFCKSS